MSSKRQTPSSEVSSDAAALPPFVLSPRQLAQLLGKTVVLLPHSDDECNVAGLLLAHRDSTVLFLTDSAPRDQQFWTAYARRERYRDVRRGESEAALREAGINAFRTSELTWRLAPADQELYRHLDVALDAARALITQLAPKSLLVPAYEGGHPDHDSSAFIGAYLGREFGLQVWEAPYYRRSRSGKIKRQEFLPHPSAGKTISLAFTPAELEQKKQFWARYTSQADVLSEFTVERELYRPAPAYEFSKPPHGGKLNYEAWQWTITPQDLIAAFAKIAPPQQGRKKTAGSAPGAPLDRAARI